MGTFTQTIEVSDPQRTRFERVEALVDTGATFSVFPASFLRRLGVQPSRESPFVLGDGRHVSRPVGEVAVRVLGQTVTTLVVFGDEGHHLLGAHALEGLLLAVDPASERLVPTGGVS